MGVIRKTTKIVVMLVMSILVLASVSLVAYLLAPLWDKWKFERQSLRLLCKAHGVEELQKAVGPLGIVFKFSDGSWIAIRYKDSHAGPGWSKAIAMDSVGRFYESDFHFCGSFMVYRKEKQRYKGINELLPEEERIRPQFTGILRQIDSIASSPNLPRGREQLLSLGFEILQRADCSESRARDERGGRIPCKAGY